MIYGVGFEFEHARCGMMVMVMATRNAAFFPFDVGIGSIGSCLL